MRLVAGWNETHPDSRLANIVAGWPFGVVEISVAGVKARGRGVLGRFIQAQLVSWSEIAAVRETTWLGRSFLRSYELRQHGVGTRLNVALFNRNAGSFRRALHERGIEIENASDR